MSCLHSHDGRREGAGGWGWCAGGGRIGGRRGRKKQAELGARSMLRCMEKARNCPPTRHHHHASHGLPPVPLPLPSHHAHVITEPACSTGKTRYARASNVGRLARRACYSMDGGGGGEVGGGVESGAEAPGQPQACCMFTACKRCTEEGVQLWQRTHEGECARMHPPRQQRMREMQRGKVRCAALQCV